MAKCVLVMSQHSWKAGFDNEEDEALKVEKVATIIF